MINTKAVRVLTTRFGQYLIYKETINLTAILDTFDAGAIKVKFGIGSISLINSLKV